MLASNSTTSKWYTRRLKNYAFRRKHHNCNHVFNSFDPHWTTTWKAWKPRACTSIMRKPRF